MLSHGFSLVLGTVDYIVAQIHAIQIKKNPINTVVLKCSSFLLFSSEQKQYVISTITDVNGLDRSGSDLKQFKLSQKSAVCLGPMLTDRSGPILGPVLNFTAIYETR